MSGDARLLRTDCSFYRGSMPCAPHKISGQLCADCSTYRPFSQRVLVVKLGAMGDVFRTTALLPDIVARHEQPQVVWLTRADSVDLLAGNPLIDRIITTTEAPGLQAERFDAVYAFDSDVESLAYARGIRTEAYHGFIAGPFATCVGVASGGDATLFEMGIWDDLKRTNRTPYLNLLAATAGLTYGGHRPWIVVDDDEARRATTAIARIPRPLIGVNVDASERWERKQWNAEYVVDFVRRATHDGLGVMLFGGAEALVRNQALAREFPGRAIAFESTGNSARLIAGIAQCDLLLTGDTLAMHLAWALQTPIVALFGPTSLPEIRLGRHDRRLAATELTCLACYLKTCTVDPHCMDRLTPDIVYANVREVLAECV